jgi:GNAT superfamily N-acetyltransferase
VSFRIAPAEEKDVPVILQLIKALAEYERLTDEVLATESDIRQAVFGPRPFAEIVLAFSAETPIGFAVFFHNFSTFVGRPGLHLEDVFVVPRWRGRGVGRQLLSHVAQIAIDRQCGRMEWAVLNWNEPALGFYRNLGADVMDQWRMCRLSGDALARVAASASGNRDADPSAGYLTP